MAAFRIPEVSTHRSGHWAHVKRFSRRLLGAQSPAAAFIAIDDASMLLGWALRNVCAHGSSAEAAALLFEAGVSLADPKKAEWGKEASLCQNVEDAAKVIANGLLPVLVKLTDGGLCQMGELVVLVSGAFDHE